MPEPQADFVDPEVRRAVDAARSIWVRRLIDHSRANSLLFYRELKAGTLELTGRTQAIDRLLNGEALGAESLAAVSPNSANGDSVVRDRLEREARQKTQHALVALQRKSLSNLEEKGIETLHLAMGLATWPAADGGRPYAAPVLLFPAALEVRGRSGDDVRLRVAGEPQLNPVLLYVLEENHRLRVGGAEILRNCGEEDESGQWRVDHQRVFDKISAECALANVPGFEILSRVILANFQFAKMAMVEDLRKNGEAMASSAVVAGIAGHSASRQRLAEAVTNVDTKQLDERPAADDYLVLDADSTQQRAIVLIGKGQNGVVQGPPGTGKSQTIANLIAQSVAEGRRVLFVAEKRAALDAVIKRLSHPDVGLRHLVLDLHGASVSRKEVMARVAEALEQIRQTPPTQGTEAVHREFEARRKQLNEHARRVNAIREPAGTSVNRIIGRLLRLPDSARSTVRFREHTLMAFTAARFDEVRQWVLEGAANPTLLLGTDLSPWNNADITDGRRAQEALDLAAMAADKFWPAFAGLLDATVRRLGIRAPSTINEAAALVSVLRDLHAVREHYAEEIFDADPSKLARTLAPASGSSWARIWAYISNGEYRAARNRLLSFRTGRAPASVLRAEAERAADALGRWRNFGVVTEVPNTDATDLASAFATLAKATTALGGITESGSFGPMTLAAAESRLRSLANDQTTPYRLPRVYDVRAQLASVGLTPLLDDLRQHAVPPTSWGSRFEYVWLYSTLEEVIASDAALAAFNGRTHEQLVEQFRTLDAERVRLAAGRVRRLHAERAIDSMNEHFDQTNLVKAEASKKSRHIPLRDLLSRAPDVLTRIAPCWVASPLSVSQLLDGGRRYFDIVVFDEASQVLQEEAVPSLYRAGQVVVAGDRHQLPPTTFFATVVEGEDEAYEDDDDSRTALAAATAAVGGYESLLGTLEAFLPNWLLEWHYRSEDERLIAFSNSHIYDGRLVTFPSARGHEAIRHVLVPHDAALGSQEESASREVEEVVREVLRHAEARPHESLGVITMGIKHANRVQAALDRALEARPGLSEFFSLDREERFFVKNLETVQGDERDAILLSVGYGKTAAGDLPHRFGPLTHEAGHRRLNVAVTRAKRRMCVISSFSSHEIDLNRSGSRGVMLLKAYLDYAASGGLRLPEPENAGEVGLNAFEADISDALRAKGIVTRPQFGASRYRIDLVAMHPEKVGRPVLAIECDGASYHSSATARDRDRLRQAHLQRLGWRFHRIWSTDWFYSREQELARAIDAFEDAVRQADLTEADITPRPATSMEVEPAAHPTSPTKPTSRERGPKPSVPTYETIDDYSETELLAIVDWVSSDGLLRTDEELVREVFAPLPFDRLGRKIRARLEELIRDLEWR